MCSVRICESLMAPVSKLNFTYKNHVMQGRSSIKFAVYKEAGSVPCQTLWLTTCAILQSHESTLWQWALHIFVSKLSTGHAGNWKTAASYCKAQCSLRGYRKRLFLVMKWALLYHFIFGPGTFKSEVCKIMVNMPFRNWLILKEENKCN